MDDNEKSSSWNEWSRYVLKELEKLNSNYDQIKDQLTEVKTDINQIRNYTKDIAELKEWKKWVKSENEKFLEMKIEYAKNLLKKHGMLK